VRGFHPYYTQNDRIELQIYLTPYSSTLEVRGSQLRLIDATGADLEHFLRGDAVHVRVESETQNYSPDTADTMQVLVRATLNGDYESVQLQETGPDTATFEGAITTAAALYAWVGDGLAQVDQDEPLRGEHDTVFGTATDEATAGDGNPATLPPVAADDAATTDDGTAVAIDVLSNDSDPEGRALQIVAFTQGTHGSVSGGGLGPLTYTPSASFTGTDTFTYRLRDADGDEDDATATVTVQLVNQPPDAVDDSYEVDEDVALWFEPLTNDVDPENEGLVIQWATDGAHGTVQAGPDSPWAAYRPSVNFNGSDSFVYRIADPFGAYDVATVHVTVRPVPDPPSVRSDSVTTDEDVPVLIDVLANDSDPDGDALTITAVGTAAGTTPLGQATIENGHVRFVPDANKKGTAWLNYTASDPSGLSASNLAIVTIRSVPDAPVANPDVASTNEEAAVTTAVLANDTDGDGEALTLAAVGQGAHGSVTIDGAQRAVYTPAVDFFGTDTFTYTAADPTGRTATGTVTVTVTNLAEAPDARDDAASTDEDTAVTVAALANDVDADGDTLTITAATQGAHGGVTFAAGSLTYTPAANYHGADSFTYTVDDGTGRTDTATVNVTVGDVNDAPERRTTAPAPPKTLPSPSPPSPTTATPTAARWRSPPSPKAARAPSRSPAVRSPTHRRPTPTAATPSATRSATAKAAATAQRSRLPSPPSTMRRWPWRTAPARPRTPPSPSPPRPTTAMPMATPWRSRPSPRGRTAPSPSRGARSPTRRRPTPTAPTPSPTPSPTARAAAPPPRCP